jgi:hypothetical protein
MALRADAERPYRDGAERAATRSLAFMDAHPAKFRSLAALHKAQ